MMPFGVLSKAVSPRHAPDTLAEDGAQADGRLALNQVMNAPMQQSPLLEKTHRAICRSWRAPRPSGV